MPTDPNPKERDNEYRDSIAHFEHSLQEALEDSIKDATDHDDQDEEDDK